MPVRKIQAENTATYYTLKNFEYTKKINGKPVVVKEPAFTIYNKETEEENYFSNSIGGYLYAINIGEPKTFTSPKSGQPFIVQDLFFEIHSYTTKNELIREVVKMSKNSSFAESIISKLIGLDDFSDIDLQVGRFKPKDSDNFVNFTSVYSKNQRLENKILIKKADTDQELDGYIYIPAKIYKDAKKKTTNPTTQKIEWIDAKEIDSNWVVEKDQIFENSLEILIEKVKDFVSANPLQPYPTTTQSEPDYSEFDLVEDVNLNLE